MIEWQLTAQDFARLRFRHSPLSEALFSLYMLHSDHVHPLHRQWAKTARERLTQLDTTLLRAIAPPRHVIITPPVDLNEANTIERQLQLLADTPPDLLRAELEGVWRGIPMPDAARQVIADGPAGARRVAQALGAYWNAVIAPYWEQMQAVLDAELAYRARQLTVGGISALLKDLHPELEFDHATICINGRYGTNYRKEGDGLLLVPSVFAGASLFVDSGGPGRPAIFYAPRGIGAVWEKHSRPESTDPLSALIGCSRASIMAAIAAPKTTTSLAGELGLSCATVSEHLAVLKRCGLVTSWRSGRCVLYQRTSLASGILSAFSDVHLSAG